MGVDAVTAGTLAAQAAVHVCVLCGADLTGRRVDARFCDAGCRREAARWVRILSGEPVNGYRDMAGYLNGRQSRAKRVERPS